MKRIEKLQNVNELVTFIQKYMLCEYCPILKKCSKDKRLCCELLKEYFEEEEKSPADLEFEKLGYTRVQNRSNLYKKGQFCIEVFDFDEAVQAFVIIDGKSEPSSITPKEYQAAMLKIKELKELKEKN